MKLSNLIHQVWKDERTRSLDVRLRKDEIKIIVQVTLDHIGKSLVKYGILKLQGLFTLEMRNVKGRKIKHPVTKKETYTKDFKRIGVKPSKKLKDEMDKLN